MNERRATKALRRSADVTGNRPRRIAAAAAGVLITEFVTLWPAALLAISSTVAH